MGIIKALLGKFYFAGVEFAMKLRILIFVTLLAVGFSSACFSHKKTGNLVFLLLHLRLVLFFKLLATESDDVCQIK